MHFAMCMMMNNYNYLKLKQKKKTNNCRPGVTHWCYVWLLLYLESNNSRWNLNTFDIAYHFVTVFQIYGLIK